MSSEQVKQRPSELQPVNSRHPTFTTAELLEHFRSFSREPFVDILAYFIGCAPNPTALQEFANEHPDKWASAINTFAKMSGFTEKTEIVGNINVQIEGLGDSQLLERLAKVQADLVELDDGTYGVEEKEKAPTES